MDASAANVLILRDRKPGHAHQAEGLALALGRIAPILVQRLEVRRRPWAANSVLNFVIGHIHSNHDAWLRRLYSIHTARLTAPDVIVGSGRPTGPAALLLARHFNTKVIFSGRILSYRPSDNLLMVLHSPRYSNRPRCVLSVIPCVISAEDFAPPRRLACESDLVGAELSLLLGGKAHGYSYASAEWHKIANLVAALAQKYGIKWNVSTSRRSPQSLSSLFRHLAQTGKVSRFIDYRLAPPGSATALFGADAIIVSEDSLSMVAEGIAAGRKVLALQPRRAASSYASEVLTAAAVRGGFAILPILETTPEHFVHTILELSEPAIDARQMLSDAISPFFFQSSARISDKEQASL